MGIKKALELTDDEESSLDHKKRKDMLFSDLINVTELITNNVVEAALKGQE